MTLTTMEPVSSDLLLTDLIKLADKIRDKQRYLEMRSRDSNPNYEAGATPADAVKAVGDELDALIARFTCDHAHRLPYNYSVGSRLFGTIKNEFIRRQSRLLWKNVS